MYADFAHMQTCKQTLNSDHHIQQLVESLTVEANQLLDLKPMSIMDKGFTPPSGDKHDYMSQGPYWWPDPNKPDGLPYIRRDGEVNPERSKFTDQAHLSKLIGSVTTLSRAYYFTDEERYAEKTIALLHTWFLAPETKMNPHLEYGQAIPGRTTGRGIGIIETRGIGKIADAVQLIRMSPSWNNTLEMGIKSWMRAYLEWLLSSDKGKDESIHPNNHGTWYNVQAAALALFTDQEEVARDLIESSKETRLDAHIMADGSQPKEIARTRSFSYSTMNLRGLFQLALIGEQVGIDLWNYRNVHGADLEKALEFLLPAALGQETWRHQQIKPISPGSLIPHLIHASRIYDEKYGGLAVEMMQAYPSEAAAHLLYPIHK